MDAGPLVGTPSDSSPTPLPPSLPSDSPPAFLPSPLVPPSTHSPSPPDSCPPLSPSAPPPAHSLPPPDSSPTTLPAPSPLPPLPLFPMPPSTHLPLLPLDPLPVPLRPPLIPPPAQSSPLSDSSPEFSPSPWPLPLFPVHTASSLPPPGLPLASLFQALNSVLMLPLVSPARSSLPLHFQSPPTSPISSPSPHSLPPRPPDTITADSADSEQRRRLDPPTLSHAKAVDTAATPRKEYHLKKPETQQQGQGEPQNHRCSSHHHWQRVPQSRCNVYHGRLPDLGFSGCGESNERVE
ncbi:hypothetical protein EDB89DRAFT_2085848 [Lactarius sanguifluus]|nr:hypothetical protein EDB89DRAFT_2085848 [Lactarius sanguifluus]